MWSPALIAGKGQESTSVNGVAIFSSDDVVGLSDHLGRVGSAGGRVVLCVPAPLGAEARTALTVAVGQHPRVPVARFISDHAPLALYAALLSTASAVTEPGRAASAVEALLRDAWSGAVVSSVTALMNPPPRMSQHLRSLLPGSSFLVRHNPVPAVLAVGDVKRAGILGGLEPRRTRWLLTSSGAPQSVVSALQSVASPGNARHLDVPGDWKAVYGRGDAHQLVLIDDAQSVRLALSRTCPTCELLVSTRFCPYCRVATQENRDVPKSPQASLNLFVPSTGAAQ